MSLAACGGSTDDGRAMEFEGFEGGTIPTDVPQMSDRGLCERVLPITREYDANVYIALLGCLHP